MKIKIPAHREAFVRQYCQRHELDDGGETLINRAFGALVERESAMTTGRQTVRDDVSTHSESINQLGDDLASSAVSNGYCDICSDADEAEALLQQLGINSDTHWQMREGEFEGDGFALLNRVATALNLRVKIEFRRVPTTQDVEAIIRGWCDEHRYLWNGSAVFDAVEWHHRNQELNHN